MSDDHFISSLPTYFLSPCTLSFNVSLSESGQDLMEYSLSSAAQEGIRICIFFCQERFLVFDACFLVFLSFSLSAVTTESKSSLSRRSLSNVSLGSIGGQKNDNSSSSGDRVVKNKKDYSEDWNKKMPPRSSSSLGFHGPSEYIKAEHRRRL